MSSIDSSPANPSAPLKLSELKELFREHLSDAQRLKRPEGIATGVEALDRFLFWRGIPKGAVSLFGGELGSGATSLWIEAAATIVREGRWVAWVNHDVPLSPLSLYHKGLPLERFIAVEKPVDNKKLFWLLQELMSSSLFSLVGCDLGALGLREHQLRKLQAQARQTEVALVLLSQRDPRFWRGSIAAIFALIIQFEKRRILISRALHRPTPHALTRSVNYARFTYHTGDRIGFGSHALVLPSVERA